MNFNENRKSLVIKYTQILSIKDGYIYIPTGVLIGNKIQKNNNLYFKDISGSYYPFYNNNDNYPYEIVECYVSIKDAVKYYKNVNELDLQKLIRLFLDEVKDTIIFINNIENKVYTLPKTSLYKYYDNVYFNFEKEYFKNLQNENQQNEIEVSEQEANNKVEKSEKVNSNTSKQDSDNKKDLSHLNGLIDIIDNIQKNILHQDRQVKEVVAQIYKSLVTYPDDDNYIKSNIIINGNTGCGKTEIARQLAKELNVPLVIEDTNSLTPNGYVGSSVTDMLVDLYHNANKDLTLAEKGILVIDEIDKKIGTGKDHESNFKNDVLNNLLKLIEGGKYSINIGNNIDPNYIEFDTSKLIVIMLGTFNNVKEVQTKSVGFGKDNLEKKVLKNEKFGLSDEFYGRISTIVTLNDLSEKDLYDILLNSNLSPVKKYQNLAKKLDLDINFSEDVLKDIAHKAYELKSGARGLYKSVTNYFNNCFINQIDEYKNNLDQKAKSKSL